MVTRRTALGAGLAFASVALVSAARAAALGGLDMRRRTAIRPVDALLVDETIELPGPMTGFIQSGMRTAPVVGVRLDAGGHVALKRIFGGSHTVAGVSSGATLFCLERIAWDHGFRLVARSHYIAPEPDNEASWQGIVALLGGMHLPPEDTSAAARAYRPSRIDGMLHAWVMHKPAREARP